MKSRSSERGAILIMVALALLGLMAISAVVLDYGLMWTGRAQVQTSADAGALTAAIALAFEEGKSDMPFTREKAQAVAHRNLVWGQAPDVLPTDINLVPCPPGAPGVPDTCVQVDAYRNQVRNNPLPIFFGALVGVADQGVRATATAQVATANTSECLRPWAVLDRWQESADFAPTTFGPTATYDRYNDLFPGNPPPQEDDLYIPPTTSSPGTGYTENDQGIQFAIKTDTNQNTELSPGWFRVIHIPRIDGNNGAQNYEANITSCGGYDTSWFEPFTDSLGVFHNDCPADIDDFPGQIEWAAHGCFATIPGNKVGPTDQGITALIASEPRNLAWTGGVGGHVTDLNGPTGNIVTDSKRIVPIGVIDIDHFMQQNPNGANGVLKVTNIYGFFIEGMGDVDAGTGAITVPVNNGKAVVGRIMKLMGTGASTRAPTSTFLRSVMLVR